MGSSAVPAGGSGAAAGAASVGTRRAALTTLLMNLASIVERADEGILPAVSTDAMAVWGGCFLVVTAYRLFDSSHDARDVTAWSIVISTDQTSNVCIAALPQVYMFIGRSLNASLSQLGTLTLVRALFQASRRRGA